MVTFSLQSVSLSTLTTLAVGGETLYWPVATMGQLEQALAYAEGQNIGVRIIGGGSNIIAPDAGISELVISIQDATETVVETDEQVLLTVGAGALFDAVIARTVERGWWGLENLSHIPGTVGATPVQNVGAYGVEVADLISSVEVFDVAAGAIVTWSATDCVFGYRDSKFKAAAPGTYIILSVTFKLAKTPAPQLTYRDLAERFPDGTSDQNAIRQAVIAIRSNKFPDWTKVGTAGSFFKNPVVSHSQYEELLTTHPELPGFALPDGRVKIPLGYVLDKLLGLRGVRHGDVGTYEGQALVIVNYGTATAAEITDFADAIAEKVQSATGIAIEWEVTRW